jgi:hypothetical protein
MAKPIELAEDPAGPEGGHKWDPDNSSPTEISESKVRRPHARHNAPDPDAL